jgi:hypothetical protein
MAVKHMGGKIIIIDLCFAVLGRFFAAVGPKTPLNGSGSKNGAECTTKQPRKPIIRPFRGSFLIQAES